MMHGQKWTKDEINILKEKYGKIKNQELSLFIPTRTVAACVDKAKKLGLLNDRTIYLPRYTCNANYFDSPNIENSYWAGWLASDGYIRSRDLSVNLKCVDKEAIEAFRDAIKYTGKISLENSQKYKTQYGLHIYGNSGRKLSKILQNVWNIIPQKSLILKPPNIIDEECKKAFIIGLFDGDGTYVSYYRKDRPGKYFVFGIYGTEDMLSWVRENFYNWTNGESGLPKIVKNTGCCYLQYYSTKCVNIMKMLLEVPIKFRLSRKWLEIKTLTSK
jgi:hypothetical protein